jgi:hypothetical protein
MTMQDLLAVHDAAAGATPAQQALLLASLHADAPADDLAAEPVGRTTARLLRLRQEIAGPVMEATAPCPQCEETVEFAVDTGDLLALEEQIVDAPGPVQVGEQDITWRPVTFGDLTAVVEEVDPSSSLVQRCAGGTALTDVARAALVTAMGEADPLLELGCDLTCPRCGADMRTVVDVPGFVWAEVSARARVLLAEVDVLARAYGWSERDILDLTPARRAHYVDLVTGAG